jgi:putative membrane protein
MSDHFGIGMGIGGIGMILVWLVPILLLVWLFSRSSGHRKDETTRSPLEILDERYARGQIEREEYLARRADLQPTETKPKAE